MLGVDGVCIIGHGSSNGKAVKNAVLAGARAAEHDLTNEIKEAIAKYESKANTDSNG